VQKALGRGESMVIEFGCVAAFSEACKIVAEERAGLIREPPYADGFAVKITGETSRGKAPSSLSCPATVAEVCLALRIETVRLTINVTLRAF